MQKGVFFEEVKAEDTGNTDYGTTSTVLGCHIDNTVKS